MYSTVGTYSTGIKGGHGKEEERFQLVKMELVEHIGPGNNLVNVIGRKDLRHPVSAEVDILIRSAEAVVELPVDAIRRRRHLRVKLNNHNCQIIQEQYT